MSAQAWICLSLPVSLFVYVSFSVYSLYIHLSTYSGSVCFLTTSKHFQAFLYHLCHFHSQTSNVKGCQSIFDVDFLEFTEESFCCRVFPRVFNAVLQMSPWVCRCSCEWFMCLHRGWVEGATLPWASNLPIPLSVSFSCHGIHTVSGAFGSASVLRLCPATALTVSVCVCFHSWRRCADESLINLNPRLRRTAPLLENISRYVLYIWNCKSNNNSVDSFQFAYTALSALLFTLYYWSVSLSSQVHFREVKL